MFNAMTVQNIRKKLHQLGSKDKAKVLQKFFKTDPGEYGEGDVFIGVRVPDLRKLAKKYQSITIKEVMQLLRSTIHEERFFALLILVSKYSKGNEAVKKKIYELYLQNTQFINSWDLVDGSAQYIVGAFLMDKSKEPIYRLAKSDKWMLREIGKRHMLTEEIFLKKHYKKMPRTMLRYAIEKFPESKRQKYLRGDYTMLSRLVMQISGKS